MKKKTKIGSLEERFLHDIVKYGKPIIFKGGVYKTKDKKEAEALTRMVKRKK
jgi:hypothetical protein